MLLTRIRLAVLVLALLALGSTVYAQGTTAGTISGVVVSADGLPLPGVAVVGTSPALQGAREAVSDENGVYYLRGLMPGEYGVRFTIPGFQSAARDAVHVAAGTMAVVDVTLGPAAVTEVVTVTASAPSTVATPPTVQIYKKADVDRLPVGRRPTDIGELAPGVTANAFNVNQLTLAGAFGFDNVFLVNGVDVNDNLFGTSNNLFIEDAIQETSVLVHGVPAEFGRFSGGVINVVTRSGGNVFSGSLREGLSNPKWIGRTPLERAANITHADVLSTSHEGTFGGPVLRDRLWFFTAARADTANTPNTFAQNGAGYTRTDRNRRFELKLTGAMAPGQTIQGSFIENATEQVNASAVGAAALLDASMLTTRQLPNRMFVSSYNGVLGSSFATFQYSEKRQGFRNNGGTRTGIEHSPFLTRGVAPGVPRSLFYHGPYLDATDPESRNNHQFAGSVAGLVSTPRFGSHELKAGGEHFISTGIGGNSQSASGYVFFTDYATAGGHVVRDAAGTPVPLFVPNGTTVFAFEATRGARVDIKTTSFYAQDRWTATPRLTLELGARFEAVRSAATGDIASVNTQSVAPRLGAAYDLFGDSRTILTGTYGHYAGKYGQVQFAVNTNVGRPNEVDYLYTGPAGQGYDFAPGFDLANYTRVVFANFPTANVRVADDIRSPLTREFTVGLGHQLAGGYARATYAWRRASGFVEDFADLSGGTTEIPLVGTLTNRVYDNSDDLRRDYQALILQSGYRLFDRVSIDGHYTLQIENHGNFAGEAANQPGIPSIYGNFPEIFGPALDRLMPWGRLDNYQQHKLRLAANYTQSLGRFGSLDLTPLWRVNSGGVYSLTASIPVPAAQLAHNPGYPAADINAASRETVFFGERGAYDLKGYGILDFAASYGVPVWTSVRPWVKVEVYNVLNNQKQIGWDRTVTASNASALDANGIPTGYTQGARFGQATAGTHFPQPYAGQNGGRAMRVAMGVRF